MTSPTPPTAPRGSFALGAIAGVLTGLLVLGLAWLLWPRTPTLATPTPTPSASRVTVTPSRTPSPTPPAVATSATPTPTPAATPTGPSASGVLTQLPAGTFVAVLDSLPKASTTPEQAVARAAQLSIPTQALAAIDTDAVPGLTPGYYAIGVPGATSRDQVAQLCQALGRSVGGSCYARLVGG